MTLPCVSPKYKIVSEKFECDGVSNVLKVTRKYRLPRFGRLRKVVNDFYKLNEKEIVSDGLRCTAHVLGWGDCDCRMFEIMFLIAPNGGRVVYNCDIIQREKNHP